MKEDNKVIEFIKTHKKEIAIALVTGVAGTAAGVIGYKWHVSKNYGELLKLMHEFDPCTTSGLTTQQSLVKFLNGATSIHPLTPNVVRTLGDCVSEELLEVMAEGGHNSDRLVSGIIIGLKKA